LWFAYGYYTGYAYFIYIFKKNNSSVIVLVYFGDLVILWLLKFFATKARKHKISQKQHVTNQ